MHTATATAEAPQPSTLNPQPSPTYYGFRDYDNRYQAVIIPKAVPPDERDAIYKKVSNEARQQFALAKRWKAWAVLATDGWALANIRHNKPPKP
jgi:hypothetical protein